MANSSIHVNQQGSSVILKNGFSSSQQFRYQVIQKIHFLTGLIFYFLCHFCEWNLPLFTIYRGLIRQCVVSHQQLMSHPWVIFQKSTISIFDMIFETESNLLENEFIEVVEIIEKENDSSLELRKFTLLNYVIWLVARHDHFGDVIQSAWA